MSGPGVSSNIAPLQLNCVAKTGMERSWGVECCRKFCYNLIRGWVVPKPEGISKRFATVKGFADNIFATDKSMRTAF
jgi:hypothetical protein